jgi:hypothetical protein
MNDDIMTQAQEYLTLNGHQILNIELFVKRRDSESLVLTLKELQKNYQKHLKRKITSDRTDPKINELIVKIFRINMAVKTLRNGREVMAA